MMFANSPTATAPKASRDRSETRVSLRRRAQFHVEALEDRKLMAGVSLAYKMLSITGAPSGHNSVDISYSSNGSKVSVALKTSVSTQVTVYNTTEVSSISYRGGAGGYDTVVNNTSLTSKFYGYGGQNKFYGGKTFNTVYLNGNYNTYDARGGASYVYSYNGPNDNIVQYSNVYTYRYNTSNFYFV